jgi:tetratricopeptide (TPR) repeat protein
MGLLNKFGDLFKNGKSHRDPKEKYLDDLAKKDPENANAHVKLAEIYQKKGEQQKAISEYLLAADIYTKTKFYSRAIAIYKQISKKDPLLEYVYLKMAEIYREKGCLADACAQYRILAEYYENLGEKEKAMNIMKILEELDPRKNSPKDREFSHILPLASGEEGALRSEEATAAGFFDLGAALIDSEPLEMRASKEISILDRIDGVKEIFKELKELGGPSIVDPHFNYSMGVAYRELGFCDEAIEQFEIAVKMRQKPFEALSLLGFCYWEKGMGDESQQSFEKAVGMEMIPQDKILNVKYILGLLYQERGQMEAALKLLQEISEVDKGFLNAQDEIFELMDKSVSKTMAKLSNFL